MDKNDQNKISFLEEEKRALIENEEKYKAFINLSSEGIWRVEGENGQYVNIDQPVEEQIDYIFERAVFVECNETMAQMYGMKKEDILGLKVKDILVKSKPENVEYLKAFIQSGYKLFDAESIEKDSKGNTKYFSNNLVGIIRDGKLIGGWGTQRDITNIKKAEEALMKLNLDLSAKNELLSKANNELDNFIYTVTHDLNSPLSNIEGLINVLKLNPATEESDMKSIIDLMEVAVGRFKGTIKNIAQYTKSQGEAIEKNEITFTELLENVKFSIGNLISETSTVISEDFSAAPTVNFNKVSIQSILYNLISNAIKYRHPDRVAQIFVSTRMDKDTLIIEVKDNGIGFSEDKGGKIFDLFKRLHHHVDGSGVGLYIVKRIAENTGGRVEVQSKAGEGSVFRVFLKIV